MPVGATYRGPAACAARDATNSRPSVNTNADSPASHNASQPRNLKKAEDDRFGMTQLLRIDAQPGYRAIPLQF
jgi:hypothetical protein